MSGVLCAIRGGPGSHPTIRKAINLAESKKLPLYFLYVFNLDFMRHTSHSRADTITADMKQMGEFILLMAESLAAEQGVNAEGIMRQGQVAEEICELGKELAADYVILGRPKEERNVFTQDRMSELEKTIEESTGADVILVGEG